MMKWKPTCHLQYFQNHIPSVKNSFYANLFAVDWKKNAPTMKTIACFLKINYKDNMDTVCDNICIMFMELSTQKGFFGVFFCFVLFFWFGFVFSLTRNVSPTLHYHFIQFWYISYLHQQIVRNDAIDTFLYLNYGTNTVKLQGKSTGHLCRHRGIVVKCSLRSRKRKKGKKGTLFYGQSDLPSRVVGRLGLFFSF